MSLDSLDDASLFAAADPHLSAERKQREARLARAGLAAALEALGAPSFVVSATGRVLHTSAAGAQLAGRWGRSASSRLREVIARPGKGAYVLRLAQPDAPEAFLVVLRREASALDARAAAVAAAWELTPREVSVLRRLVQGDANKEIALAMRTAEVTVERHVTALLRKARCDGRARLVARFWTIG